ncbi:ATP-binding cassette domain-containing protein [Streptomyces sp. NPDC091027]|uniref:ATP-binding cassette domain-containing protein n=1 Tax=Streptomyces sp. NPDC091027 TaxID=3365971 RepID=UPI0037FDEBC4
MRLESLSKRYGRGDWILRDVDLEAPAGEVVAFTGGNGSGKSTLLRIAVGLSRPTRGAVAARPPVVGYVTDRFSPNERMSAAAYLAHMGRVRGMTTSVASARAGRILDRLALVGGKHAPLRSPSKGNAQKVALAQALPVDPGLLVLDEPWSGLDADAHGVLAEIMTEVAASGGTVVFTDHRECHARALRRDPGRVHRCHAVRDQPQGIGSRSQRGHVPLRTAVIQPSVAPNRHPRVNSRIKRCRNPRLMNARVEVCQPRMSCSRRWMPC